MENEITGYELSRDFFDWCFENPEKITPTHIAMYFFIIEHCNRLGWKTNFGLPTVMVKDAIGIRNFRTYTNTLHDLVDWGFIKMIEKSKNQYSSNIIAIVKNAKATTKALYKATQKQLQKQSNSTCNSIATINKHINILTDEQLKYKQDSIFGIEFINDDFEKIFKRWIEYKIALKDNYKTEIGAKTAYNKLLKLSNSNAELANKIVTQSIEHEWKGLFDLKYEIKPPQPTGTTIPNQGKGWHEEFIPKKINYNGK